jgi:hypothetical protein
VKSKKPYRSPKVKPNTKPIHGVFARNYPKSVSWKVDFDYLEKLTQAELEWLAQFADRHYGGDFRGETEQDWTTEERRAAYSDKNRANRDAYTIADVSGRMARIPDLERSTASGRARTFDVAADERLDLQFGPEYLDSAAYRAAVEELRASLPPRGVSAAGSTDPRYLRAKAQLERIRTHGEADAEADTDPTDSEQLDRYHRDDVDE